MGIICAVSSTRKHHFVPYAAVYAKALAMPPPAIGVVVKLSSVEVMCAYCKIYGLRVKEWRGDLVVLEFVQSFGGATPSEEGRLSSARRPGGAGLLKGNDETEISS